jgi:arginine/ornithine N-succinyltransferase beta subunit
MTDWQPVCEAVLGSPGALSPVQRCAIFAGEDPLELAPLLAKVRRQAYRIVDADVEGLDTDVVVEAALAAALGVALAERRRAVAALS